MQTYRGPAVLDEIEKAIGLFTAAIVPTNGRRVISLRARNAIGFAWNCGCEARGNGSPFCVWRPCDEHSALARNIDVRDVPRGYEHGVHVLPSQAPPLRPGEIFVSAEAAIAASFAVGEPVGYAEGAKLMLRFPDGRREVVSSI